VPGQNEQVGVAVDTWSLTMNFTPLALGLILGLSAVPAMAETISFPVGTPVMVNAGTYTVIAGDYKFSKNYYLAINASSDAYTHAGGLWVQDSGGVGVKVERLDGQPFSFDGFTAIERPYVSGALDYDPYDLDAYAAGSPYPFGSLLYTDYDNHTYDTFYPVIHNPSYANITAVWIQNDYPFILDSITLTTPVPEPETWALLAAGLALIGIRRKGRHLLA
jgi:PEP-CTERM motif